MSIEFSLPWCPASLPYIYVQPLLSFLQKFQARLRSVLLLGVAIIKVLKLGRILIGGESINLLGVLHFQLRPFQGRTGVVLRESLLTMPFKNSSFAFLEDF
jgi:hypothetical protein